MAAFSDSKWIEADSLTADDVFEGQSEAYGTRVFPAYSFDQADVVLSLGADLGTWGNTVENAVQWAKKRKLEKTNGTLSKVFVFEAGVSITGSSADERYGIVPGSEALVGLAIAQELIVNQKKTKFAGNADVISV